MERKDIIHSISNWSVFNVAREEAMLEELEDVVVAVVTKRENGEDFPAEAFAYVPDPEMPSGWKLRLWESLDSKVTVAQVARAVMALGVGFRGNKVEIPAEDHGRVVKKVLDAWLKVHPDLTAKDAPNVLRGEVASFSRSDVEADNDAADSGMGDIYSDLSVRQQEIVDGYERIVEESGMFLQDSSGDGAHYFDGVKNPFVDEGIFCGNCVFYCGNNACELVSGVIDDRGLCKLWVIPEGRLNIS